MKSPTAQQVARTTHAVVIAELRAIAGGAEVLTERPRLRTMVRGGLIVRDFATPYAVTDFGREVLEAYDAA